MPGQHTHDNLSLDTSMLSELSIGRRVGISFTLMLSLVGVGAIIASAWIDNIVTAAEDLVGGNALRTSLMLREIEHLEWNDELYTFLTDRRISQLNIPLEPDKCKMGIWLNGVERRQMEVTVPELAPLFKAIEEPHRRLHESAYKITKAFRHTDRELPRFLMEQHLTQNHIRLLTLLGEIVRGNQPPTAIENHIALCPLEKWLHGELAKRIQEKESPEIRWQWSQLDQAHTRFHNSIDRIVAQVTENRAFVQSGQIFFEETLPSLQEMLAHLSTLKYEALQDVRAEEQADEILRQESMPSHQTMMTLLHEIRGIVDKRIVTDEKMLTLARNTRTLIIGLSLFAMLLALLTTVSIRRSIVIPMNRITRQLVSDCAADHWQLPNLHRGIVNPARTAEQSAPVPGVFSSLIGWIRTAPRFLFSLGMPTEVASLARAVRCYSEYQASVVTAQQQFIANVAHQLKNPLTGIYMQINMIADDVPEEHQEHRNRVHKLRDSVHKLGHLIHQLLTLARCSPEAIDAQVMKIIDLDGLLEENAAEWFDAALAHKLDLGFEIEPARILGLFWLIREMLNNLVDNAIKYSHPGGTVTIRCGHRPNGLPFLEIEDSGPGIPLAERKMVFERFYRAEDTHDTRSEGTGLGLAIVKEVVERHQARISLETPDSSVGTRVVIEFPRND